MSATEHEIFNELEDVEKKNIKKDLQEGGLSVYIGF